MMKILTLLAVIIVCSCNSFAIKTISETKKTTHSNSIHTIISTNKSVYKKDETIELFLEVKNTGNTPYTLLPWGTPLENKFTRSCLIVTHNNITLDYKGIMVKRISPTEADYITLETGKKTLGKVNLLDGYKLIERGVYTIQFKETYNDLPESNIINIEIK